MENKYEIIKNISVLTKRGLAQFGAVITQDQISNMDVFKKLVDSGSLKLIKEIKKKKLTEDKVEPLIEHEEEKTNPFTKGI